MNQDDIAEGGQSPEPQEQGLEKPESTQAAASDADELRSGSCVPWPMPRMPGSEPIARVPRGARAGLQTWSRKSFPLSTASISPSRRPAEPRKEPSRVSMPC
jgi:hypothetical protein